MILYLDTNVIVYNIAASPRFRDPVRRWLDWHATQPGALLVTSRLTVLEVLVGPIKKKDIERKRRTEAALSEILILDLDDLVVRRAAEIRATYPFRSPDALHLATAAEYEVDGYLTADRRLKSFRDVRVIDALRDRPGPHRRTSA
ncbi:MAG: type II toxin-antitoxin system VapC family toxin [Vicinamibacteria bacterium]